MIRSRINSYYILGSFFLLIMCFRFVGNSQNSYLDSTAVYFEIDAFRLSSEQVDNISQFIAQINNQGKLAFTIKAYTDYLGDTDYNEKLSRKRAAEVDTLLSRLTKSMKIYKEVSSYGERFSQDVGLGNKGNPKDRRVDILLHFDEDTIPIPPVKSVPANPVEFSLDTFDIDSLQVGDRLVLRNLNFIGGRHVLLRTSIPELIRLKEIMLANPTLEIAIEGHICCQYDGRDGYDQDAKNYKLSINRAKNIYDYLILNGVEEYRLTYRGFGSAAKIYQYEKTDRERMLNRRVEMKIIKR